MAQRSSHRGLVVAPQAEAARAGARVLEDGGTAADAAVTAALVQGAVDPHRCGIGGFGCATLHRNKAGKTECYGFHGRAGSRAREDQWTSIFRSVAPDGFGFVVDGKVNDVGYQAITVPGVVAGLAAIHGAAGRMPWRELVLRAVPYAEDGFLVTKSLHEFWRRPGLFDRVSTAQRLGLTSAGKKVALKNGEPYKAGEVFRQPELARTYRRLAEEGAESFYRGALADEIARDWDANGALVTSDDLRDYSVEIEPPVARTYRGAEVRSSPLPGGGVALLQTLARFEAIEFDRLRRGGSEFVDAVATVLHAVSADRLENHGDPRFEGKSAEELLAPEWIARLGATTTESTPAGADSPDTTQLTIVDAENNAVAFSHSLGYGSGVFTPGLGFMFNNCMSAFDPRPGKRNSIAPGKARSTAVAETIVLRDGTPILALGSPGAARITAALALVIVDVLDYGRNIAEAVIQPRFDSFGERRLLLESRIPLTVADELRGRGWNVEHREISFGVVGRVYAIEWDRRGDGERLVAGVDPGEPGDAGWPVERPTGG